MAKLIKLQTPFTIRAYNKNELCKLYGISVYKMNKWLEEMKDSIGPKIGYYYNPKQVQMIVERYGIPGQQYSETEQAA